jgi:hypothetical protein
MDLPLIRPEVIVVFLNLNNLFPPGRGGRERRKRKEEGGLGRR